MPGAQVAAVYGVVDAETDASAQVAAVYGVVDAETDASAQVAAVYVVVDAVLQDLAASGASTSDGSAALTDAQPARSRTAGGARYELWLSRDDGTRLALLSTVVDFEYAIVLHETGACRVTLPGTFDKTLLAADRRLEFWRAAGDGPLALERVYLIRRIVDSTDAAGARTFTAYGLDGNDLLRRRIVAYYSGEAQADMTDEADDMCRAIVVDNLGADADATRQISSTYFSVAAERSAGDEMSKAFSRRNVLTVLQEIANAAEAGGTAIYWHMADVTPTQWEFRTYTGQPGIDHTFPDGPTPVLLGLEYGNLAQPVLDEDYSNEATWVYAGGAGEGLARIVQYAEDVTRGGRSIFGRCEAWADARQEDTTNGVLWAAWTLLNERRPVIRFAGEIVDTPGTRYGLHWRWGDRVTAAYAGQKYDALIRAVHVQVDEHGRETITSRLETIV